MSIILLIWVTIYLLPIKEQTKHPFFENDRPLVMAHQGGLDLAPSSTLEAFQNAANLGVDVIEFDLHITKDGHLVAIHDPTVDRTTDGTGRVNNLTLQEIKSLDAAAHFQDINGKYSFKDKGVKIPTLEEIFQAIPNMKWNIEIKDTNDPEQYRPIAEKLWKTMQKYNLENNVLIVSFDQDIIEMVQDVSGGKAVVAGGRQEVTKFVLLHKLRLNGLYRKNVDAIEIPIQEGPINLMDKKLIRAANKQGIDVHYWTINDRNIMEQLLDLGADGIITDRPDILLDLLKKRGYQ
ncbi:glycerophosphodiester phosphodiesterase [Virgibacillus soli]|uniref:glycerophosphodiester phosphodiesterase n=1 Tax=Paracerasibacillus soli TaxID=480284 RepID=UPI0035ED6781